MGHVIVCYAGNLIKSMRAQKMSTWPVSSKLAMSTANNFTAVTTLVPPLLNTVDILHRIVGAWPLKTASNLLNRASYQWIPTWNPYFPRGASKLKGPLPAAPAPADSASKIPRKVR